MASCKDCVHVEVCREYVEGLAAARGVRLSVKELDSVLECDDCKHFKDRSRFVELPCKHGDTLFRINNGKIEKGVATTFFYGREFQIVDCRFPKISTGIPFHRFGKTVFLTREQAEQALKERENDAE